MYRIRPRTCVLCGAVIGLVTGVAVYVAVSSSAIAPAPAGFKPATVAMTAAPARLAACAAAQTLKDGICIVHVVHTIVAAGPAVVAGAAVVPGSRLGRQA